MIEQGHCKRTSALGGHGHFKKVRRFLFTFFFKLYFHTLAVVGTAVPLSSLKVYPKELATDMTVYVQNLPSSSVTYHYHKMDENC